MTPQPDSRIDRSRVLDLAEGVDSGHAPRGDCTQKMLGQVYDGGSIPTTLDKFFLVHPTEVDGDPCDGCPGTLSADTSSSVPVLVIGPKIPAAGDYLECFRVGGRWVAGSGSTTTPSLCEPSCSALDGLSFLAEGETTNCAIAGFSTLFHTPLYGSITDANGTWRWTWVSAISIDGLGFWRTINTSYESLWGCQARWSGAPNAPGCPTDIPYEYRLGCGPGGVSLAVWADIGSPDCSGYNGNNFQFSETWTNVGASEVVTPTVAGGRLLASFSAIAPNDVGTILSLTMPSTTADISLLLAPPRVEGEVCCLPCPIPKKDLVFSFVGDAGFGGTMVLDPATLTWARGDGGGLAMTLSCVAGRNKVVFIDEASGSATLPILDYTCDPFHLHFTYAGHDAYIDE